MRYNFTTSSHSNVKKDVKDAGNFDHKTGDCLK